MFDSIKNLEATLRSIKEVLYLDILIAWEDVYE